MTVNTSEAIHHEIVQTVNTTVNNTKAQVADLGQATRLDALEAIAAIQARRDAGEMSERRYQQVLANIKAGADMIVQETHETACGFLINHRHQFDAMQRRNGES